MNKTPILYMQTDPRWANKDYSAQGESTTIGKSGCGPTCAAMLVETLTGKTFTPADACAWALKKGYKAPNQGTYYSYFVPQFQQYGIACKRLNGTSLYGSPSSSIHTEAFDLLKQGYYLIACMGPGTWTSGGHYVVVWWEDGWVRINDPASTATARVKGNLATFKKEVKYYWAIDAREHNRDELAEAVDKLHKAGIIDSPDYWKKGTGYSDANVAALIKKVSALCN
ncbi:MAG: C39 family peptidase [Oscillospiraceae bacterium]